MLPVFRTKNLPGIFDEFLSGNLLPNFVEEGGWKSTPAVNIYESNEKFAIEIAAPGLEKEDEVNKGKVIRSEFRYASFQRSFALPKEVDVANIKASNKNGILTIELPKKVEYKNNLFRQIEIQ